MQQALEARFELDEDAEIGKLGDLALLDVAGMVTARDVAFPRIIGHLFETQCHAFALLVDVEDDALDLVALVDDLAGMPDFANPAHVADVQQAVDAFFNFDESAIIG